MPERPSNKGFANPNHRLAPHERNVRRKTDRAALYSLLWGYFWARKNDLRCCNACRDFPILQIMQPLTLLARPVGVPFFSSGGGTVKGT
jgi:hypothetical protein